MSLLTDKELLRLGGLEFVAGSRLSQHYPAQCDRMVRGLRRAARIVPVALPTTPPTEDWMCFVTAIVVALSEGCAYPHSFVSGYKAQRVASQLANVSLGSGVAPDSLDELLDSAARRQWLEVENNVSETAAYRATLLGERMAHGLATLQPPKASERLKFFRPMLLRYLSLARNNHTDTTRRATDLHHDLQDAWIDLADLMQDVDDAQIDSIVRVVECRHFPEGHWDTHPDDNAPEQLDRLILSVAKRERLAELSRCETGPISRSKSIGGTVNPDNATQLKDSKSVTSEPEVSNTGNSKSDLTGQTTAESADGDIQYISREEAAALCGVTKGTLERWFSDDINAPDPVRPGGGGKRHEYDYRALRSWLMKQSGRQLPVSYDASIFR